MKGEVGARYKRNLEGVDNPIKIYEEVVGPGPGGATVANTDIFLRVQYVAGDTRPEQVTLGQLAS